MEDTTMEQKKIGNVIYTLLNQNLSPQMAEMMFLELCFINPKADTSDERELTMYPLDWFRNKSVYDELVKNFETVLKLGPFSTQQRFRAFLALMYLKGLRADFRGYKKFLTSFRNKEAYRLASNLFDAEKFVRVFSDVDAEASTISSTSDISF